MVEYDAVLFLDTDVLPLCNLDYVFDLVGEGEHGDTLRDYVGNRTRRRNLILAWKTEPSNAGFFIVRPGKGELDELNEILRRQRESQHAKTQGRHFRKKKGGAILISVGRILDETAEVTSGTSTVPMLIKDCYICGQSTTRRT